MVQQQGTLHLTLVDATGLKCRSKSGLADAFASINIGQRPVQGYTKLRSEVIRQTVNPQWNERFEVRGRMLNGFSALLLPYATPLYWLHQRADAGPCILCVRACARACVCV